MLTCKTTRKDGLPTGSKWDAKAVRAIAIAKHHSELRYYTSPSVTWGGDILCVVETSFSKKPEKMISIHYIPHRGYGVTEHLEEDAGIAPVPRVMHKDLKDAIDEAIEILKK